MQGIANPRSKLAQYLRAFCTLRGKGISEIGGRPLLCLSSNSLICYIVEKIILRSGKE